MGENAYILIYTIALNTYIVGAAQLVERSTSMRKCKGSIPTGDENFISLKVFYIIQGEGLLY